jgi:hypothetical protein
VRRRHLELLADLIAGRVVQMLHEGGHDHRDHRDEERALDIERKVAVYLATNPHAAANEVTRQIHYRRSDVLEAVKRLRNVGGGKDPGDVAGERPTRFPAPGYRHRGSNPGWRS